MLPQEAEVLNLWYNRAAFDARRDRGPPTTLDELVADAAKLRAAGYIPSTRAAAPALFDAWVYMQIAAQTDLQDLLAAQTGQAVWTKPGMIAAAAVWGGCSRTRWCRTARSARCNTRPAPICSPPGGSA